MSTNVQVAQEYLDWCANERKRLERAAQCATKIVEDILESSNLDVHVVKGRAKSPDSMREKLLRKAYTNPKVQITDLVGVRVVTYYAATVDEVATLLKGEFRIHKRHSIDKRTSLGLREFGYRSYHLIAKLEGARARAARYESLRSTWFEIQIRSVLEHTWAEIEHEIVYKSGFKFPLSTRRRFAALAGTLEVLEREFGVLREEGTLTVDQSLRDLSQGGLLNERIDSGLLLAGLEHFRPDGLGFRRAVKEGRPFPARIEGRLALALHSAGVTTLQELQVALQDSQFKNAIRRYARKEGVPTSKVSHLAAAALVIGLLSLELLDVYFPELQDDRSLSLALQRK